MTAESPSPPAPQSQYGVVGAWALSLFAITGIGMLPLFFYRLDLSKLSFSTPIPVVAGIGIELTAYAPTLAALLVTGFMRAGGFRRLLRPESIHSTSNTLAICGSKHRDCFTFATRPARARS